MEIDKDLKQDYLRNEILNKGYDTEEFLKLLIIKKGENGINLDLWTINELKEVNF